MAHPLIKSTMPAARSRSLDEGVLETDSEQDEFAAGFAPSPRASDGDDSQEEDNTAEDRKEFDRSAVSQWRPDDWGDHSGSQSGDDESDGESDENSESSAELRRLKSHLQALPLSALVKAQVAVRRANFTSSTVVEIAPIAGPSRRPIDRVSKVKAQLAGLQRQKGKAVEVQDEDDVENDEVAVKLSTRAKIQRDSKHAPTAMSSKRQVTRSRQVVEIAKADRRDPRFSAISAGQADALQYTRSYDFLPDMLRSEYRDAKKAVAIASKAERTCSWADKSARIAERERSEAELGRLRTKVERSERGTRERNVLAQAKMEEKKKRAQGKGAWFMKKSEKRDLLIKSRFDALEQQGGKNAVKKALERKRKKIAHKEKKSRPFAPGEGAGTGGRVGDGEGKQKRRRI